MQFWKRFKLPIIIGGIVVALIVLFLSIGFGTANKAIALTEQIHAAKSDISVQEKRRNDLLFNLVDCVKEYDKHEYNTLRDVVEQRVADGGNIDEVTTQIKAVAEAYPDLKSSENYKELMNELATTENLIANYRSNYNESVEQYSRYVKKFPNRMFIAIFGGGDEEFEYLTFDVSEDAPTNLFGDDAE